MTCNPIVDALKYIEEGGLGKSLVVLVDDEDDIVYFYDMAEHEAIMLLANVINHLALQMKEANGEDEED